MLNICICDDSTEFVRVFENQLRFWSKKVFAPSIEYNIYQAFNSAAETIDFMADNTVDALFLDIDMPVINGFELAKRASLINPNIMIVFVSAHDHFVFEVFAFSPFAYLRKTRISEDLPGILERIADAESQRSLRMDIETVDGSCSVAVSDVLYIKSKENYYVIITDKGDTITCRGTLSGIEKLWEEHDFYRVHAAYIVNLSKIKSVHKNEIIIGEHREVIPISQRN